MKKFEQLHLDDQNQLLIQMLETITEPGCRSIEELAEQRGCSAREVWRDICADTGLDECEPWDGFPGTPKNLPEPPRHQIREF